MTEVLLRCTRCDEEIAVDMDAAILRMDVEPNAAAELLFCCPNCGRPGLRRVVGDLLTLLLFVGVEPLRLSEPDTSPEESGAREQSRQRQARASGALAAFTRDDLLAWHELLVSVEDVSPWER